MGQMALARLDFRRDPACSFWKLCGSGTGQGFTPRPNTAVWAILAVWPDEATARDRLSRGPAYRRWAARASESCAFLLTPTAARGTWAGRTPFDADATPSGPVAALTRATIRPRHMLRFWAAEPAISARIGADPNVIFKIGIGELPWLHQVTVSVWPDADTMAQFARADGAHARAIRAVRDGDWFAEELYARFAVRDAIGTWNGTTPLTRRPEAA